MLERRARPLPIGRPKKKITEKCLYGKLIMIAVPIYYLLNEALLLKNVYISG
jgi:hypothetical protein